MSVLMAVSSPVIDRAALRCNSGIPPRAVRVTVDHGEVTLHGEVEWEHQRRGAEPAVRPLAGVVRISNEIGLRPRAGASNLKRRIEEALIRQATARRIASASRSRASP